MYYYNADYLLYSRGSLIHCNCARFCLFFVYLGLLYCTSAPRPQCLCNRQCIGYYKRVASNIFGKIFDLENHSGYSSKIWLFQSELHMTVFTKLQQYFRHFLANGQLATHHAQYDTNTDISKTSPYGITQRWNFRKLFSRKQLFKGMSTLYRRK
jgi:hypothetical protein